MKTTHHFTSCWFVFDPNNNSKNSSKPVEVECAFLIEEEADMFIQAHPGYKKGKTKIQVPTGFIFP